MIDPIEVKRFFLTALAVALVLPAAYLLLVLSLSNASSSFTMSGIAIGFMIMGLWSFVLAVIGGILVGLPMWWLASRMGWGGSIVQSGTIGAFAGLLFVGLLGLVWGGGHIRFDGYGFSFFSALGLVAGAAAGSIWHRLHWPEERITEQ